METSGVLILIFLLLGAAASDDFDLGDALALPDAPQRNHERDQCSNEARDIVFLLDGSSSMRPSEFLQLKLFIGRVMQSFPEDTQFSLLQFSNRFEEHFDFKYFKANRNPTLLLSRVRQLGGSSFTATGIRKAAKELFTTLKGARSTAKKFLVVVTDGEKTGDPLEYADVLEEANRARIVRFAVGVGLGFTSTAAQRELHAIASQPATQHAIVSRTFTGLQDIQAQLKEKICSSQGFVAEQPTAPLPPSATCSSGSDPQVLQKLEQVLTALDQLSTKLNSLAARHGKCR